jgi:hypothetical protein
MKQQLLITFSLLSLMLNFAFAQDNIIYLHGAVSFPIGDFGATTGNGESGFAKTGFTSELGYSHKFSTHWGGEIKLVHSSFASDDEGMANLLTSETGANFRFSVAADSWSLNSYLVGAHYIFPFEKSNFKIQLLLGALSKGERATAISAYDQTSGESEALIAASESATGFAACFGVQYQLNLSDNFGIDFMYESIASSLSYSTTIVDYTTGQYGSSSGDHNVQFLSLGAGVHFAF